MVGGSELGPGNVDQRLHSGVAAFRNAETTYHWTVVKGTSSLNTGLPGRAIVFAVASTMAKSSSRQRSER